MLTPYRIKYLEQRPLTLTEFIGPLSLTHNTLDDLYEDYKKFTDYVSGDAARRDAIKAALAGDDGDGGGKEKKKKKKKK